MVSESYTAAKRQEYARTSYARKKAKKAQKDKIVVDGVLASNVVTLAKPSKGPKSVVNRVTEYGALFNKLNEEHIAAGNKPLKTAMEVLIEAMQSDELDLKEKSRIAEKLATFESSRAPVISIEHIENINRAEEVSADDSLADFLQSLKKA